MGNNLGGNCREEDMPIGVAREDTRAAIVPLHSSDLHLVLSNHFDALWKQVGQGDVSDTSFMSRTPDNPRVSAIPSLFGGSW